MRAVYNSDARSLSMICFLEIRVFYFALFFFCRSETCEIVFLRAQNVQSSANGSNAERRVRTGADNRTKCRSNLF